MARKAKKPKKTPIKKQKFGTSKLEQNFARNFLDKLGVKYIWQFEAKDICRFYDYYLPEHNLIIEIDGGWFHSDPRVVDVKHLNNMQKHNKRIDEMKDKWALLRGIPVMRIWEKDINERPDLVMKKLKERLRIQSDKIRLDEEKKKRH